MPQGRVICTAWLERAAVWLVPRCAFVWSLGFLSQQPGLLQDVGVADAVIVAIFRPFPA